MPCNCEEFGELRYKRSHKRTKKERKQRGYSRTDRRSVGRGFWFRPDVLRWLRASSFLDMLARIMVEYYTTCWHFPIPLLICQKQRQRRRTPLGLGLIPSLIQVQRACVLSSSADSVSLWGQRFGVSTFHETSQATEELAEMARNG